MTWAPDYATGAEVQSFVRGGAADAALFALYATASSRAVDRCCLRQFGNVAAEARSYPVRYSRHRCAWVVEFDDLQSLVGLVVGSGVTEYTLTPRNALQRQMVYTGMELPADPSNGTGYVSITAPWGWTAVPTPVKTAVLLQSSRLSFRRESPAGVAGSPQQGSELRLLERLDPDVATTLKAYVRDWWAS